MSAWWAHLSCSQALAAIVIAYLILGIGWAVIKHGRKARRLDMLTRLNSPFFRCAHDKYYAVRK